MVIKLSYIKNQFLTFQLHFNDRVFNMNMRKNIKRRKITLKSFSALLFLASVFVLATQSQANEDIAKKSGCIACHNIDSGPFGPSYKDISAKYKGDKSAENKLIARVKRGSVGIWGEKKMPAMSPQIKDDDIEIIVHWILSL